MSRYGAFLDQEVVDAIDSLHVHISCSQRELLRFVAECDARERWRADGCRDMAQWLSGRLGISNWAARRWVAAAHALENLPLISDALESGVLCLDKVLELTRFASPETEEKLIAWARRVSAAAIRRKADLAQERPLDHVRDDERGRFLRWWWFDDGNRLALEGEFPAAQGAAITQAIRRAAERIPEFPRDESSAGVENADTLPERCADALSALAMRAISEDADADRATVVVHTTLAADGRSQRAAEIEAGPVIHPEVARRLSCDARLQFVLTDSDGNALGIGRADRNVPQWLMRALRHRDRGCTFPGCGTTAFVQAHHIRHWDHGGRTQLPNLTLVCHFHHKLVHEFGWSVRLNGSISEWFRPNGKRFVPGPAPPRSIPDQPADKPSSPVPRTLTVAVQAKATPRARWNSIRRASTARPTYSGAAPR